MTSLEEKLSIAFHNQALLRQALTHKSYHNENPGQSEGHNERLEFLGDAVLELVLSEALYLDHPQMDEGQMSKARASLVNEKTLADLWSGLGLSEQIRFGKGELQTGGALKPRLLACAFEALIGALYLDQGFVAARAEVRKIFADKLKRIHQEDSFGDDFKTRLQELSQERFRRTPSYHLVGAEGPDHEKIFTVRVTVDGENYFLGQGKSKKQAEQEAASRAIKELI